MAWSLLGVGLFPLAGCTIGTPEKEPTKQQAKGAAPAVQLANPASRLCVEKGGKHQVERHPGRGEYGVCLFPDNLQCEEWAMLRGECPEGGVRVTGYATPAARFCGITGGRYAIVARSGAADEQGTCTLPGGKTCDAEAYYRMTCSR